MYDTLKWMKTLSKFTLNCFFVHNSTTFFIVMNEQKTSRKRKLEIKPRTTNLNFLDINNVPVCIMLDESCKNCKFLPCMLNPDVFKEICHCKLHVCKICMRKCETCELRHCNVPHFFFST